MQTLFVKTFCISLCGSTSAILSVFFFFKFTFYTKLFHLLLSYWAAATFSVLVIHQYDPHCRCNHSCLDSFYKISFLTYQLYKLNIRMSLPYNICCQALFSCQPLLSCQVCQHLFFLYCLLSYNRLFFFFFFFFPFFSFSF